MDPIVGDRTVVRGRLDVDVPQELGFLVLARVVSEHLVDVDLLEQGLGHVSIIARGEGVGEQSRRRTKIRLFHGAEVSTVRASTRRAGLASARTA
jgi:hypothetical protein